MENKWYDTFIRGALNAGFTDSQADFLYSWLSDNPFSADIGEVVRTPSTPTSE